MWIRNRDSGVGGLLLAVFLFSGIVSRYLRMLPELSWFPEFVHLAELAIGGYSLLYMMTRNVKLNEFDFLVLTFLMVLFFTYFKNALFIGWFGQLKYFMIYIAPLGVYFFVRYYPKIDECYVIFLFRWMLLLVSVLVIVEFIFIILFDFDVFGFVQYMKDDESGFTRSDRFPTVYTLFGGASLARPWGFMVMPQATGVVIGALVLFFIAQRNPSKYWVILSIGTIALYMTGSKTAYLVVIVASALLVMYRAKGYWRVLVGILAVVFGIFSINFLVHLDDPGLVLWRFGHSVLNFFYYLSFDNLIDDLIGSYEPGRNVPNVLDLMFGQGVRSMNNILGGQGEIHVLNSVLHIGVLPSLVWLVASVIMIVRAAVFVTRFEKAGGFYLGSFVLMAVLFFGSMHYMVITRFPLSVIVMLLLAIASRNLMNNEYIFDENNNKKLSFMK